MLLMAASIHPPALCDAYAVLPASTADVYGGPERRNHDRVGGIREQERGTERRRVREGERE
jgi:hypothetical protein